MPGASSQFQDDRYTPTPTLCKIFNAWDALVAVALDPESGVDTQLHPFRYDLVNLGRELLAQLSTPVSMNFTDARAANPLVKDRLQTTAQAYVELLKDADTLVSAESAFLLGPWIGAARSWGRNASGDCGGNAWGIDECDDFYEWNARVQLTTWNPTSKDASRIPGGPVDYAGKHWSGLIRDYYAQRVQLNLQQALADHSAGKPFDTTAMNRIEAEHAYNWTMSTNKYPTTVQGDAIQVSKMMLEKYRARYAACSEKAQAELLV